MEIALNGCGLTYEVGDVLGVIPTNCPELVQDILAALHRDFLDPAIHTRGDVEPRRIDLTLYEQRYRSQEIV